MTNNIDWTKPLELEDGTPVEVVSYYPGGGGDRTLRRADGNWFTREQAPDGAGYPQDEAIWQEDGSRYCGYPGLRVRNRIEQPAASTADDVPDWAIKKALPSNSGWTVSDVRDNSALEFPAPFGLVVLELARRIAASEPEPVGPDLVKAREICARVADEVAADRPDFQAHYRDGSYDDDDDPEVQFALSALKEARG